MQRIIALAGKKGSGKDTMCELLQPEFERLSFADPLYLEVQQAFSLSNQDLLRNRDTKELPTPRMSLVCCDDEDFIEVCGKLGIALETPLSPRKVLQLWGTEYRQAKNGKYYWVDKLVGTLRLNPDVYYCIPDMRFPHEYEALFEYSLEAEDVELDCVKIVREVEDDSTSGHSSETALEGFEIFNAVVHNPEGNPAAMLHSMKASALV